MMKKITAALLAALLVLSASACSGKTGQDAQEGSTLSREEMTAELNEAIDKLTQYKTRLDEDLTKVNSADGADSFFDLKGMGEAAAVLEKLSSEVNVENENLETAQQAAEQYREIAAKVDTCAGMYAELFRENYKTEPKELYALTVFMSGEPSTFFAVRFEDENGTEKTLYSVSSFTSAVNMDTLRSILENLFATMPVSTRNAEEDGNYTVDLAMLTAQSDGEGEAEAEAESEVEAESESEVEAETESEVEAESESEVEAEAEAE